MALTVDRARVHGREPGVEVCAWAASWRQRSQWRCCGHGAAKHAPRLDLGMELALCNKENAFAGSRVLSLQAQ